MPTPQTATKEQFNVRVSPELKARLDTYAEMVGQSKGAIAANAISDYLDWRVPQIENLKLAIVQADKGEFADAAEVERFFDAHED